MNRRVLGTIMITYLALVLFLVIFGTLQYRHLYGYHPGLPDNRNTEAYALYDAYSNFLTVVSIGLGLLLGLGSTVISLYRGFIHGALSLVSGWAFTAVLFGWLPLMQALDAQEDFRPWLLFMALSFYPALGAWLVGLLGGSVLRFFCLVPRGRN